MSSFPLLPSVEFLQKQRKETKLIWIGFGLDITKNQCDLSGHRVSECKSVKLFSQIHLVSSAFAGEVVKGLII